MIGVGLGTLVTYNPASVFERSTLEEVLQILDRDEIRHLPVVNESRQIVGILSSLDVARAVRPAKHGPAAPWERCVDDLMQKPVLTVEHTATRAEVLSMLLEHHIHSAPVVEERRLVGIVTSTDYLREFGYGEFGAFRDPVSNHMHDAGAQIELDTPVDEALGLMQSHEMEYVAVVTGGCPVGILARRGLLQTASNGAPGASSENETAKSPTLAGRYREDVPTIRPAQTMGEAVGLMLEHNSPAVAVVDRTHRLVGLLTQDDVLRAIAREYA